MTPEELLYTKTHEWVRVETDDTGAKVLVMGLTPFALEALTDLVHVELPEAGRQVGIGEALGEVESVKAVEDMYSPVDGEVVETNESLAGNLAVLSSDPFGEGWMVKIKIMDENQMSGLLSRDEYQEQVVDAESE